jgi:DNA-binding transcriptional MerR regulator
VETAGLVVEENRSYSIGDLSRRSGLSVRTIRFYSDVGIVPASARSASGYRLYDVEAVARLNLVRTLRDRGLPLESIRALLNAQTSVPDVAAPHLKVLDHQIQTLRLRRAVLRAAAKTNTTAEEVALMHRLATMSEVERQHLIDDFLDDAFSDTNANPELVAMLRAMRPELPDDPEPHQVEAWVELAELVEDPDFRASVRRMAEHQAAERVAGDRTGLHHDLGDYVRERVTAALTAGIDPAGSAAAPILGDLVERYAEMFQTTDTPEYRNALHRRLEIANDPRTERYLNLLHVINGWPTQPSLAPIFDWFTCALRSHASSSSQGV